MGNWTKGPWHYRPDEYDYWGTVKSEIGDEINMICQARNPEVNSRDFPTFRDNGIDPYEANGRLISAAPDMAEVLELLLEWDQSSHQGLEAERNKARLLKGVLRKARKALSKAKGE